MILLLQILAFLYPEKLKKEAKQGFPGKICVVQEI